MWRHFSSEASKDAQLGLRNYYAFMHDSTSMFVGVSHKTKLFADCLPIYVFNDTVQFVAKVSTANDP